MGEPAPMHKYYADTVELDWGTHFRRQPDSGLNVEQYCKHNRCSRATWCRVKKQYDQCTDKLNFRHVMQLTEVDPLLSSSGAKAVVSFSSTVNAAAGIIAETVLTTYQQEYSGAYI